MQNAQQKSWHDRLIKIKEFQLAKLMYDSKVLRNPRQFQMHWLGMHIIEYITEEGVVNLSKLDGEDLKFIINGSRLKPYRDS